MSECFNCGKEIQPGQDCMRREYKSGSRWAFWRWMDIIIRGELYLRRLHLVHTPWGGVMVHWIPRPDAQRDMHDHPVNFWSFVLRGGYVEETPTGRRYIVALNRKKATDIHRIVWTVPTTITLVFYGPKKREWGFNTKEGWVHWREYEDPAEVTSGREG